MYYSFAKEQLDKVYKVLLNPYAEKSGSLWHTFENSYNNYIGQGISIAEAHDKAFDDVYDDLLKSRLYNKEKDFLAQLTFKSSTKSETVTGVPIDLAGSKNESTYKAQVGKDIVDYTDFFDLHQKVMDSDDKFSKNTTVYSPHNNASEGLILNANMKTEESQQGLFTQMLTLVLAAPNNMDTDSLNNLLDSFENIAEEELKENV